VTDGLQNPWVMERAKAPRATVGALKQVAANGMAVEPAARYARRTFNGNCMARDLVGSAVSCRRPLFLGDRYDGTDHQAFDPNRDNRHFKRDSICGLLGRLGASRVLGRLRGLVQRVTLPVMSSWARRGQAIANHRFFSAGLVDHVYSLLLRPRFFGDRLSEV
jgi:hypothetical protein